MRVSTMLEAVNKAIADTDLRSADSALLELARKYAREIDADHKALRSLGPLLLDVLVEMGVTPKARNSLVRGPQTFDGASDKITDLRSRRQDRAANMVKTSS